MTQGLGGLTCVDMTGEGRARDRSGKTIPITVLGPKWWLPFTPFSVHMARQWAQKGKRGSHGPLVLWHSLLPQGLVVRLLTFLRSELSFTVSWLGEESESR